jgi:UDP-N-acetylglucosamine diphosphorylase/glucosamine-1-phosphate N-acetyltransferase
MNYILFDDLHRKDLFPFTLSRPVCEIRAGILTIKEKWQKYLSAECYYYVPAYLAKKYPQASKNQIGQSCVYINAAIFPDKFIVDEITIMPADTALISNNVTIAVKCSAYDAKFNPNEHTFEEKQAIAAINRLQKPWEIFSKNGQQISDDYKLLTQHRISAAIDTGNQCINPENIFIEEGAKVHFSILNASAGPIYIGKNAEVMEGSMIRGPFALGEHAVLKMGAKIYGPTTIGPGCKVGGEVNNSVLFSNSNKAHDGFLGNSVIGEWCNLGADTNNSNLKNNYGQVKVWDMAQNDWQATGLQFCGLLMGDHSKAGINTMFNTGTVTGFCANIFDGGFPPKYIPSYSWGGQKNAPKFELDKAIEVATRVFERRGIAFSDAEKEIFEFLYHA